MMEADRGNALHAVSTRLVLVVSPLQTGKIALFEPSSAKGPDESVSRSPLQTDFGPLPSTSCGPAFAFLHAALACDSLLFLKRPLYGAIFGLVLLKLLPGTVLLAGAAAPHPDGHSHSLTQASRAAVPQDRIRRLPPADFR
jgi:hypothetical protein